MDTNNNGQATDDQELAQVLAGMNQQADEQTVPAANPASDDGMQFEETGTPPVPPLPTDPAADAPAAEESAAEAAPAVTPVPEFPAAPAVTPPPEPTFVTTPIAPAQATVSPELESIKKDALEQLRPLVDRLDLDPQEKFDTLLLIIRSTDDQSLVGAANEAAKAIPDETKRAEALLDVIKEIDFFSHPA